ncbi:MAG TPA: FkbM family methyltransferase [Pyrinomonadaceae bacterium]|nr:FkbM family methyltransferase [Pyrinomonadaceae bacterium]
MILLRSVYEDQDSGRTAELFECLRRNDQNEVFDEIHLFIEESNGAESFGSVPWFQFRKVVAIPHDGRLTFKTLFKYANQNLAGRKVVIANADIFFDQSLALVNDIDLDGKLLCLSRWDVQPDGSAHFFEHPSSQDAWIFQAPIQPFNCDFHLGKLGCDNLLAWEAANAGLKVSNPSRSIKAHHLHLSQVRRYTNQERLHGPSKSIVATRLASPYPSRLGLPPVTEPADIAFHETMGYTVARLETGASSHNNESRSFTTVPADLAGLQFTQVVACAVSPIEIEFRSSGKLYVLVGNDWAGSETAVTWLADNGYREDFPIVETEDGCGFEVWSLVGDAGNRLVVATQVMLVSRQLEKVPLFRRRRSDFVVSRDTIVALTSLSPAPESTEQTRNAIESWRRCGLEVCAFNHPSEIVLLERSYDVDFVPVNETSSHVFGRNLVPIKTMVDWAAAHSAAVLLINADIELRMDPAELKRIRWLSKGGLCYLVRYNHDGDTAHASREWHGIDAFLFDGRDMPVFGESFLSMGQPFWDYWVPITFLSNDKAIYSVEFPAAFHRNHHNRWSWDNWHRCALEFDRLTGYLSADKSFEACTSMSVTTRQNLDQLKAAIPRDPLNIRDWVRNQFSNAAPKVFLELGAQQGTDTAWMADIPGVTLHAFEPDPRNQPAASDNVLLHRFAIADRDGAGSLILSTTGWGQEWTHSSSIKQPKNHLLRYPVEFGNAVTVDLVTLDSFTERMGMDQIDFIWADIQGAEGEMIRGGSRTLARTRFLYTEYSDDELYEGQIGLSEILEMLPDYRVVELWPDDVLLENTRVV